MQHYNLGEVKQLGPEHNIKIINVVSENIYRIQAHSKTSKHAQIKSFHIELENINWSITCTFDFNFGINKMGWNVHFMIFNIWIMTLIIIVSHFKCTFYLLKWLIERTNNGKWKF